MKEREPGGSAGLLLLFALLAPEPLALVRSSTYAAGGSTSRLPIRFPYQMPKCARSPVIRCVAPEAIAAARIGRSFSGRRMSAGRFAGFASATCRMTATSSSSRLRWSGFVRFRRASSAA